MPQSPFFLPGVLAPGGAGFPLQQANKLFRPFQTAGEQIDRPMALQAQEKIGAVGHNGLHPGDLPGPQGDGGIFSQGRKDALGRSYALEKVQHFARGKRPGVKDIQLPLKVLKEQSTFHGAFPP